jgi:spore maturation protein SpmB
MVAVLLVDVGLAIYILPKDPAMDLFIYSDGVQVDFTIGEKCFLLDKIFLHPEALMKLNGETVQFKKEISAEAFVCLALFIAFFWGLGAVMGITNMFKTMMQTAFDLLNNVCFYLMGVSVLAGGCAGLLSEFGVISLINRALRPLIFPLYGLPGSSALGIVNCYMSDNPAILAFAKDDNFRRYFKKYQMAALTNLGTSFGMGLIITTMMMSLPVEGAAKAALVGNLGAVIGSVVSVRLMLRKTKAAYGPDEPMPVDGSAVIPENMRIVREGSAGSRFIQSMLHGGKNGVDMGIAIIPGVLLICTIVLMLTNGPGPDGVYTGGAGEGVALLPALGAKLRFLLDPLFGFDSPEAIAVPITALGSSGAAMGMVEALVKKGAAGGNDLAVFTAICMCWSGYLSTHIAMMDALDMKEMTGHAILSHTVGGICAGIAAHLIWAAFF